MEIQPLQLNRALPQSNIKSADFSERSQFADLLKGMIENTDHIKKEADATAQKFILGESEGIHDTMITLEKADLSFRLLMQVRNKVMDAYQEIMRMQV